MRELFLLVHPQAVTPVKIRNQVVANHVVFAVLAFVVLYFGTVVTLTFLLLASGMDFVSAFTAVIAMINNMGPGLGGRAGQQLPGPHGLPDLGLLAGDAARPTRDLLGAGIADADVLAQVGEVHGEAQAQPASSAASCSAASPSWRCSACSP
jgi:hypothetical protein